MKIRKTTQDEKQHNRNVVWKQGILSCLRCLVTQGWPLREHGDDKDSNFKQLLNNCGEDDLAFVEWLRKKNQTYTSPVIRNEMSKDMSLQKFRLSQYNDR